MLNIGIIRETKNPPDTRVPLTPQQCAQINRRYPQVNIVVQPSDNRSYSNAEYAAAGVTLQEDLSDRDVLMGIKEVKPEYLIPNKAYFFFSHTKKKQPYNKPLMQALIKNKIRMIDYECLTHQDGQRVIGFGFYAGLVGAHNGMRTYGLKEGLYELPKAYELNSFQKLLDAYALLKLPPLKIAITGSGKVAAGLLEIMNHMDVDAVEPQDFINKSYNYATYTHLKGASLYRRRDNDLFNRDDFHAHPEAYQCIFHRYWRDTDILMNGIYWDEQIDRLFEKADVMRPDFNLAVIADVTCDIDGSVPINVGASTIQDPVYGIDRHTLARTVPYLPNLQTIDVMAVDNLPNELPRDASQYFGSVFEKNILGPLIEGFDNDLIFRGTICANGQLMDAYNYLEDYAYS